MAEANAVEEGSIPDPSLDEGVNQEAEGTTAGLFGNDFDDSGVKEAPATETKSAETVVPEVKADAPVVDFLNLDEIGDRKVKTKIDGVEGEVSLSELVKGYQTDKHLSQKGQELGAQRLKLSEQQKQIDDALANIQQPAQHQAPMASMPEGFDPEMLDETTRAAFNSQNGQIQTLTDTINNLAVSMQGVQLEQQYKQIDAMLKAENPEVFTDFMPMIGEVEAAIMSMPPERQAEYGNAVGYRDVYKTLKIAKMHNATSDQSNEVKVVPIESGGGVSTSAEAASSSQYQAQFTKMQDAAARQDIRDFTGGNPLEEAARLIGLKGY